MKEFTNFVLGMDYILSIIALYSIKTTEIDLSYISFGYAIFLVAVTFFLFISVVWITIYSLAMIHDLINVATQNS